MQTPTTTQIIQQTQHWIQEVVIGLNFCPFARKVVVQQSVGYEVVTSNQPEKVLLGLAQLVEQLEQTNLETALLLLPQHWEDFYDYLDLLDLCEYWLREQGYEGIFQLASFHPNYQFAGTAIEDASNYTNRSPYPILHLLREDSIERAVAHYPNPENIPEQNQALAKTKGTAFFKKILASCHQLKP